MIDHCRVVIGLAAILVSANAHAWEQKVSSKGAPVHWEDTCITVYLHEAGSDEVAFPDVEAALKASLDAWNHDCSSVRLQYGGTTNQNEIGPEDEDPMLVKVVIREKKWPYTDIPVAYTLPHWNETTGKIVDADIELDGEHISFTTDPAAEPYKMDVQSVVTHELGHIFGFVENWDDEEATMFGELKPGEDGKRTLNQDDIDGLCTVYPAKLGDPCPPITPTFVDVYESEKEDGGGGGCSASSRRTAPAAGALAVMVLLLLPAVRRRPDPFRRGR